MYKQTRLLVLAALVVATGCARSSRVFIGPPIENSAIKVRLERAQAQRGKLEAVFVGVNRLDKEIVIDRNQIAVVSSQGEFFRLGARNGFSMKPKQEARFGLRVSNRGVDFQKEQGLFFRFDGFYLDGNRIQMKPLQAGKPAFGPGQTNVAFRAPDPAEVEEAPSGRRGIVGWLRDRTNSSSRSRSRARTRSSQPVNASMPPPKQSAPVVVTTAPSESGWQEYRGPRHAIANRGTSCAALPIQTKSVSRHTKFILDEFFLTELQRSGFQAIGPDDIDQMLGFEKMKDVAGGCDDASCIAEIGGALGVDYLATGKVVIVDKAPAVSLKLIDVRRAQVLARSTKVGMSSQKELPRLIGEAVRVLAEQSRL